MIHLGNVPASSTIYVPFTTYAGSTGASVTCTGLAVTDVEIYKNGSTTQRSSDAGIALLDTDGIDFDSITGLHGFSIDLSDNTDASFYAVGSWYWVVVSAITVDSQTVTFLAATFRIAPAEGITGYPKTDIHALKGDATSATDLQDFADAGYDPSTNKVQGVVLVDTTTTTTTATNVTTVSAGGISASSFAAGAITSTVIATDAIDADAIAANAVTEIQSGLATASSLASLDTKVDTIDDFLDTEIAAIKAKTDNLPADPADQSLVEAAITAATSPLATAANLATVAGYLDTEIAAILADTNELQTDWANGGRLDLILDARASQTSVDTIDDLLDTEMPALTTAVADLPTNAELATAITTSLTTALTEGYRATNATGSVRDLLYEILQSITEFTISGTTKTVKKLDGSTTAKTYTLNDSNLPTGITETT